jgi:hypothetical protein
MRVARKRPATSAPHHIVRLEASPARWRAQFRRSGRVYTKDFTDAAHGGKTAAMRKAMALREQLLGRLPVRSAIKSYDSRNKTGVVGVQVREDRRAGARGRYYCATWSKAGRRFKRMFSVAQYGEAKARALAIDTRRHAVEEILRWRGESPLPVVKRANVGVVGVHLVKTWTPAGTLMKYYNATWTDASGRDRQRAFSLRKYGARRALALAIQARRKALRQRVPA